jgi:hypothetical protein
MLCTIEPNANGPTPLDTTKNLNFANRGLARGTSDGRSFEPDRHIFDIGSVRFKDHNGIDLSAGKQAGRLKDTALRYPHVRIDRYVQGTVT